MTVREIIIFPDSRLREKALSVTEFDDELETIVRDMVETMYAFNGIGLAAPQIGVLQSIIVMDTDEGADLRILVNPEIMSTAADSHLVEEGCLSFPGFSEKVSRHMWVRVKAHDVSGNDVMIDLSGLNAQCVQHEIDHLLGVVLVDNIGRAKRRWITNDLKKLKKKNKLSIKNKVRPAAPLRSLLQK